MLTLHRAVIQLVTLAGGVLAVTGRTVYHGPRDQVVPFFEQLGFQIPDRKGVADFIQEICSEKDQEVHFSVSIGLQHC